MMYLITFNKIIYTTPMSVGQFLVSREDGDAFEQMTLTEPEVHIDIDDVLQPALRNGFRHPEGLLVDESLVDIMTAPQRLEMAAQAQSALESQLEELHTDPIPVTDATHAHQVDQLSRKARLDHEEALRWAQNTRNELLERPVDDELQRHWEQRPTGSSAHSH
ncbi:hypothetical protein GCM10023190_11640 [Enteractinococcus fodinae]|uniref:Uncharacterized protein n=1 Tax=Enteractinococcus fodinae TaxID=684663 RepID=A0ABU2AYD6_9MICC|nr:hypothetical protein [Enteractinococcus fodinae]MDR7346356.1 hypothetical protein [Enteractinococcus fodinae]